MESNKPLSVHMTHNEYEQYKKFIKLFKSEDNRILWGTREERMYGGTVKVEYEIYSQEEVKNIADSFLKDEIDRLKDENDTLDKVAGHYLKEIDELKREIRDKAKTIALFNSYDYSMLKKSWWRSLWN